MALIRCPNCGEEINDSYAICPECNHILPERPNNASKRKKNHYRKWVFLTVALLVIISFVVYKTAIVRTVESGNGWKHQIGHFGTCEFAERYDCEEATHRIHAFGINENYCEVCWEKYGKRHFESLSLKETSTSDSKDATNAKICAEQVVKDNLKAPSTAKFCKYSEMTATNLGGNKWRVTGFVDAQNSFGAVIRQNWSVTLTLTGNGFKDYSVEFS